MVRSARAKPKAKSAREEWKMRYEKQRLLLNSLMSLLNKYGASIELEHLYRELLLTIMGQFLAKNACYYSLSDDGDKAAAVLAFGSPDLAALPEAPMDKKLLRYIANNKAPFPIQSIPPDIPGAMEITKIAVPYHIIAPLLLKNRLIGFVFLGEKITGEAFLVSDYELLQVFCDVSAITFNNARLLKNARTSIDEIQKLADLRIEIISRISHEFRTPITVIKTGLHGLILEEKHNNVKKWILESLERLENLIQSLLQLSEEHFEESPPHDGLFDVIDAITSLIAQYSEEASRNNIKFRLKNPRTSRLHRIRIDENTFKRIIGNVIDNALKFSNPASSITLEFEDNPRKPDAKHDGTGLIDWKESVLNTVSQYRMLANVEMESSEDQKATEEDRTTKANISNKSPFLVLKIRDSGIGIPEDELAHITEPFRQASNSPDLGIKGKGLGLTVTQRLLSQNGGLLYCNSKENEGTTFTLFFPVAKDSDYS